MAAATEKDIENIWEKLRVLQARIERLENNPAPTIPIYDSTNWPKDAVEGQIVIAPLV